MALPAQNVKHVQILCPGFAADCLETIDEIAIENKHGFLNAGGERFEYIPALNSGEAHVAALTAIIQAQIKDWLPLQTESRSNTQQRYQNHPYNSYPYNKAE